MVGLFPISEEEPEMEDVFAQALAEMPMPEYGVGTAWPTEECPFCAWHGESDAYTPPEDQRHAERCPVRLARVRLGLPAPVGEFHQEHEVGTGPNGTGYHPTCETCGWRGALHPKTDAGWRAAAIEARGHREASREPSDGMGPRDSLNS